MLAEERVAGEGQQLEVERVGHMPGEAGQERVWYRPVDHGVPVGAGASREAGVEGVVDRSA